MSPKFGLNLASSSQQTPTVLVRTATVSTITESFKDLNFSEARFQLLFQHRLMRLQILCLCKKTDQEQEWQQLQIEA